MRVVHWVVTAPAAVVAVLFAVSNRAGVTVTLWPLPGGIEAPLYLVVLLALVAGFVVGEFIAWNSGRRARRAARVQGQRIEALERELAATQARLATAAPPRVDAGD